jgi:hypothetical protein
MKAGATIAVISLLLGPAARGGDDTDREKYISAIESIYFKTTVLSADSPFVSNLLVSAKSANPGVSDGVWTSVASEVAGAFEGLLREKGGLTDTVLRSAMQDLSTADLAHLTDVLSDPVVMKYFAATRSAATQKQLAKGLWATTARLEEAVNKSLRERGLKEVH